MMHFLLWIRFCFVKKCCSHGPVGRRELTSSFQRRPVLTSHSDVATMFRLISPFPSKNKTN